MSAPLAYYMRALENMGQKSCEGRAINVAQETKQRAADNGAEELRGTCDQRGAGYEATGSG
jgi:hypothetical protein